MLMLEFVTEASENSLEKMFFISLLYFHSRLLANVTCIASIMAAMSKAIGW